MKQLFLFFLIAGTAHAAYSTNIWAIQKCTSHNPILVLSDNDIKEYNQNKLEKHLTAKAKDSGGIIDYMAAGQSIALFEPLGDSGLRVLAYDNNPAVFSGKVLIKCPKLILSQP